MKEKQTLKDHRIINPKLLDDIFKSNWWLSKTLDDDGEFVYSFEYGDWGKTKCVEAKSADRLAKEIGKLIINEKK